MESFINISRCIGDDNKLTNCHYVVGTLEGDVVLSDEDKKIFDYVNFVTICAQVSMFGIAANIINIFIFYRQGFGNTVNIAFLGLAISDLCCLIALEWISICMNPLLPVYGTTWASVEVMYLSGAWPHVCSCRITSFITVYITAERFISIALPLKVKQIVTAKRTTLIICLIYIINIITLIPEYATSYLDWRFDPAKNRTLVGIIFRSSRNDIEGLCHAVHSMLSATSFFGVIIFTFLLVIKLKQTSEWRKEATSTYDKRMSTANKERKTVKMVVLIASVLIVCYIPGAIISLATFIVGPEFNIKGKYRNISAAAWSIALSFQSINSSVNIFLYYNMSSKYRQTFKEMLFKLLKSCGQSKLVNVE